MSANNDNSGVNVAWSKQESGNGGAYEIGVPTEALAVDTIVAEAAQSEYPINIGVSWEVTGDKWIQTTGELAKYISSYKLNVAKGNPIFDWKLEIHNEQSKSFRFYDRTKDYYDLSAGNTGHHYVAYNSDAPQITTVSIKDL